MIIDLRSDTVTKPTEDMRLAIYRAEVGDDVYGDDPTVNRLEELGAEIFGKEASLLVTSGTQGNLLALLTHCKHGDEVILEANSHIYLNEAGGMAAIGGLMPNCIIGDDGYISPALIEENIHGSNIHHPTTSLICLENTHNFAGGTIIGLEQQSAISETAKKHNLKMHLDGARAFNAIVELGCSAQEFVKPYDSIQVCLSKGLGAPIGSLLIGSKEFIAKARRKRKMIGGGMRQAGIIAAAGIYALENMVDRLVEDHHNAKLLTEKLLNVPGLSLDMSRVDTNIVFLEVDDKFLSADALVEELKNNGVLINALGPKRIRLVTHLNVTTAQCLHAAEIINRIMQANK